jgi:hypothetical protein
MQHWRIKFNYLCLEMIVGSYICSVDATEYNDTSLSVVLAEEVLFVLCQPFPVCSWFLISAEVYRCGRSCLNSGAYPKSCY